MENSKDNSSLLNYLPAENHLRQKLFGSIHRHANSHVPCQTHNKAVFRYLRIYNRFVFVVS